MGVLQLGEFHIGPCAITEIQHILKCVLPRAILDDCNYEVIGNIRPLPPMPAKVAQTVTLCLG